MEKLLGSWTIKLTGGDMPVFDEAFVRANAKYYDGVKPNTKPLYACLSGSFDFSRAQIRLSRETLEVDIIEPGYITGTVLRYLIYGIVHAVGVLLVQNRLPSNAILLLELLQDKWDLQWRCSVYGNDIWEK